MQHFLHTAPPPSGSGVVMNFDRSHYAELLHQSSSDPAQWFSSYIVHIDDNVLAGVTCWDQQFDIILEKFNDPQHGRIWVDEFRKIWPTLFSLFDNTIDERYGEGALAELVDPDDMNRKWFVVALVGIADLTDDEIEQRCYEAADKAVDLSLALTREFQNELSWKQKAKIVARGSAAGYREGREKVGPWQDRLGWLQTMLGQ
jgi:hypothetical protein